MKTDWNDPDLIVRLMVDKLHSLALELNISYNLVKVKRHRKKQQLLKEGIDVSEVLQQPDGEEELRKLLQRRSQAAPEVGKTATKLVRIAVPAEHVIHHKKLQEALEKGPVVGATIHEGSHEGYIKNADNEIEYTRPLANRGARFNIRFNTAYDELLEAVRNIKPLPIKISRTPKQETSLCPDEWREDTVAGDHHFGYLRRRNGELIPTHDEIALSLFHQYVAATKPARIILGGDVVDFPMFSRWQQTNNYIDTLNPTLNRVAQFLNQLVTDSPTTKIVWMEGNHEDRPQRKLTQDMEELLKLTRPGESEPALSIPNIFKLQEAGIEYVRSSRHGRYPINDRLKVKHGTNTKAEHGTELYSTIEFNGHKWNAAPPKYYETQYGIRTIYKHMMPMMGRIDGVVPSHMSSQDHYGEPDTHLTQWTQGFGRVQYLPGDVMDPIVEPIFTNPHDGYFIRVDKKVYRP